MGTGEKRRVKCHSVCSVTAKDAKSGTRMLTLWANHWRSRARWLRLPCRALPLLPLLLDRRLDLRPRLRAGSSAAGPAAAFRERRSDAAGTVSGAFASGAALLVSSISQNSDV